MNSPIALEEARARLLALATPPRVDEVPVDEAAGRYLAGDLIARRTQPACDMSSMDGFAVAGSGPWRIVGETRAGALLDRMLKDGEAARISTGAACPEGTSGIVPIEDATVDPPTLAASPPEHGRWIRRQGFDFTEGSPVLAAGTRIGPAQIALARAAGHGVLPVAHRPLVAVVECGDELVADPTDCPRHLLPASNGAMIAAMVAAEGGRVRRIGPLPDDRRALTDAFTSASDARILVTTAGASVGEHDHVRAALEEVGATLSFWRVAIRPGKPLMVASRGDQIVLGLPGNPASSYVTAVLFLLPLLRALQGAAHPLSPTLGLRLAAPVLPGGERREFLRARLVDGKALPLDERDSSALNALASADLLIDRPAGTPALPAGATVTCHWLGAA